MNYNQTLEYLFGKLPMYHRIGAAAYKPNLDNTIDLCKILGNPEKQFRSVHIAGTNGKGSTSHMLASIFQHAGYKTGLYTSPHLRDFRERIRINGEMISENDVVAFVSNYKEQFEKIDLSFFEMTVGLAFEYFAKQNVDIAVIETGLGGRLDSTNVIVPELSVITNIGYDHMNLLGETLEKIAFEKSGIIKKNVPVVIGESALETDDVFTKQAAANSSPVYFASEEMMLDNFSVSEDGISLDIVSVNGNSYKKLHCDLNGIFQAKNIKTVLRSCEILSGLGFSISDPHIRNGLKTVKSTTGLMGRWHKLDENPLTYCDVGHNKEGISEVLKMINHYNFDTLHMVIGFVRDKDLKPILEILPKNAQYYFCAPDIPRALSVSELLVLAKESGISGNGFQSVSKALIAAKANAGKSDFIFAGGSTFVVAEIIHQKSERF